MDPWVALPPETPVAFVTTYSEAFNKIAADPEFIEKGKRISEDIAPKTYADIEALVKTAAERLTQDAEPFIRAMHTKKGLRPKE